MRIWDYRLLPYLPEAQFKGQLRELVAIMHDWRDKGKTNHLLINRVMYYEKHHLFSYFVRYALAYFDRYKKQVDGKIWMEFIGFAELKKGKDYTFDIVQNRICSLRLTKNIFDGWHTKEYLRINMSNLAEKHFYGIGKSRITDEEWQVLLDGYKAITGEEYKI